MEYKSMIFIEASGIQKVFSFGFDYLRASFIKIQIDGVGGKVYGVDYHVNGNSVEFVVAPTGTLRIYRETPTDKLVSWAEGSTLLAKDMNIQQVQTTHILEETVDSLYFTTMAQNSSGQWDAQNKRITNTASPVSDNDVVTKKYLQAYASLGGEGSGLDPEVIAQMLSDVTAHGEAITQIELGMVDLKKDIPTKLSELENDANYVQDANYVHTDNNFTATFKQRIENLKELSKINFSEISPEWSQTQSGYVFTYTLTEDNTLLGLFKLTEGHYVQDTSTTAYIDANNNLVIEAPEKFSGYFIVNGTVAYGNLEELLGVILNEEVGHTYTLDEILGKVSD